MTKEHRITPPAELIEDWIEIAKPEPWKSPPNPNVLCTLAAQWGADQELDACSNYFNNDLRKSLAVELLNVRRPKPPSLKEQALEQLDGIAAVFRMFHGGNLVCDTIRRALEQLDD